METFYNDKGTHLRDAFTTVQVTPNNITWRTGLSKQWAAKLGVSIEVLLKRMLIVAVEGQQYTRKFLKFEFEIASCCHSSSMTHEAPGL